MKAIIAILFFATTVQAQVESDVVTQAQFEKHQQKQKKKEAKNKVPYVEDSQRYIASEKKLAGKKYRMRIVMGGVLNFHPIKQNTACAFGYSQLGDSGFGKMTGDGFYWVEAEAQDCIKIQNRMDGGASATIDMYVKFIDTVKTVDKQGKNLTLPRLLADGQW